MENAWDKTRYYVIRFLSQLTVVELTDAELIARDLSRYQIGPPQSPRAEAEALKVSYEGGSVPPKNKHDIQ